jgi:sulfate adenylyltransferase subunit 1 (EFTu-like GTPase family)
MDKQTGNGRNGDDPECYRGFPANGAYQMRASTANEQGHCMKSTLSHSSLTSTKRRIVMTVARPDDSLSNCLGIIRSGRLATGRTIRHLPQEMNAIVALANDLSCPLRRDLLRQQIFMKPNYDIKINVSSLLTRTDAWNSIGDERY